MDPKAKDTHRLSYCRKDLLTPAVNPMKYYYYANFTQEAKVAQREKATYQK